MTRNPPAPPRPRVRRGSAEDHDELKREIVRAAFAIHAREGVGALSMRGLAQELGLSPMALYRYYPSKADLLRAMWEVVLSEAQAAVRAAMQTLPTARERLRASIDGFLGYWEAHPAHFRLVYMTPETMQATGEASPLTRSGVYTSAVDLMAPLLDDLVGELGGHAEHTLLARDLRMSLMVGYLHARLVNTRFPWSDFDALRAAAIETIAQGVEACLRTAPPRKAPARPARR